MSDRAAVFAVGELWAAACHEHDWRRGSSRWGTSRRLDKRQQVGKLNLSVEVASRAATAEGLSSLRSLCSGAATREDRTIVTGLDDPPVARTTWRSRTELDVTAEQLAAIDGFIEARHTVTEAASAGPMSREERLDLARQQEVMRREHQALIAQTDQQLRSSGVPLQRQAQRRVVIAHRSEWFASKMSEVLEAQGVRVAAWLENGADAVGAVIAEQPDVALVEDALAMLSGEQVIRELRQFCPDTIIVTQVTHGARVGSLLDAGAAAAFTRSVPPGEVAQKILELLAAE